MLIIKEREEPKYAKLNYCFLGIHWGMLSDRIGRRPVILQGLIGTITSILLFGLSKSFIWALLSRSLCGLLVSLFMLCLCINGKKKSNLSFSHIERQYRCTKKYGI